MFTATQGLSYPLLSLLLTKRGTAAWAVGVSAAMTPVGMLVAGLTAGPALNRIGSRPLANLSFIGSSACLLALRAVGSFLAWLPLRLLLGCCLAWIFIVTETWINEMAPDHLRGRTIGLYSAVLSVGFAFGPVILLLVGTAGWGPFLVGACCTLAALVPLVLVRADLPLATRAKVRLGAFARAAPLLLVCTGAAAVADQGAMSLLPVFGLRSGLGQERSTLLLVVMICGSISLLYPVGWLADRFPLLSVSAGCAAATGALAALLPLGVALHAVLWPVVFLWGGAYYGVYVVALIGLGRRFKGADLVAGNAAFGAMWGVGGLLGPVIIGGAMSGIGRDGFPGTFAILFLGLALALVLSRSAR